MAYQRLASVKTAEDFRDKLNQLELSLDFDQQLQSGAESPLGQAYDLPPFQIGNRFCILPMEGWDGTEDGKPSELTRRRWINFGLSGAKLIWGGEAVAVRHDGRANPNQLLMNDQNASELEGLRELLESTHIEHFGRGRRSAGGFATDSLRPVCSAQWGRRTAYGLPPSRLGSARRHHRRYQRTFG